MSLGKILLVDDEPHIVEMLKLRLEASDYEIFSALNGFEALEILESGQEIDAALIDIMMPGMHGIELLRRIKEIDGDVQVVIMTGYASLDTAIEAVKLGAFDYVRKPFDNIMAFMHTVKSAVDKRRLILENRDIGDKLKKSNDELQRINDMLGDNVNDLIMLHHITESVSGLISVDAVVDKFIDNLMRAVDFRKATLLSIDADLNTVEILGYSTLDPGVSGFKNIKLEYKSRFLKQAVELGKSVELKCKEEWSDDELARHLADQDTVLITYYPLIVRGGSKYVLILESSVAIDFRRMNIVELFMRQAALVLDNARMFTQLMDMNTQLMEMDQIKAEFISTVSHELRTPLTTVKESVSLLADGIMGAVSDKQQHVLKVSKSNIDRLARLIEDLLNMSRLESGKIDIFKLDTHISSMLEKAIMAVKSLADQREQNISVSIAEGIDVMSLDEDRIIQVLINLLSNSMKYSPLKSEIKLTVESTVDYMIFRIGDQGLGIDAKQHDRLFKRFSQIDRKDGSGAQGTGLGLAISKELVEMHGGKIWLEASSPGKGSVFAFRLPREEMEEKNG